MERRSDLCFQVALYQSSRSTHPDSLDLLQTPLHIGVRVQNGTRSSVGIAVDSVGYFEPSRLVDRE